jgi:four helix bundle protein
MTTSFESSHLSTQFIRSSSSAALNYGEAQSAESQKDFIHKLKLVLKELRETFINLKITNTAKLCDKDPLLFDAIKENDELIRIFVKSIATARNNQMKNK